MLFISCFLMAVSASADVIGNARLSLIRGDVSVQTADSGNEWIAASINLPLTPGDKVWVPEEGRAEIQILGGTYLRADAGTDVEITKLNMESDAAVTQIALPQGRIYVKYRNFGVGNSVFQIDTPMVSAMAYGSASVRGERRRKRLYGSFRDRRICICGKRVWQYKSECRRHVVHRPGRLCRHFSKETKG